MFDQDKAKRAVVRVGNGRGFVVGRGTGEDRVIITAAHCLKRSVVPCASFSHTEERTYKRLLGQLGKKPTVWAECLFIDPIADIAALGPPDNQVFYHESESYGALAGEASALSISDAPEQGRAWLLSLDGDWFECEVGRVQHGSLFITEAARSIACGMSGSPIVADDGSAIGVVGTGTHAPNARLAVHLPGWLLVQVGLMRVKAPAKRKKG